MNVEKVFESIISLSGKIDKKIEDLEFQISETLKGRYSLLGAADLAEDLLQEVEEKTAFADGKPIILMKYSIGLKTYLNF
jgi:hypothetical protein